MLSKVFLLVAGCGEQPKTNAALEAFWRGGR
jgi:hypothetical protein